jgi:putative peptidoglycan binding protein
MRSRTLVFTLLTLCATAEPARTEDVQPGQILGSVLDIMQKAIEAERYRNSPEGQATAIQPGGLIRSQVMIVQQLLTQKGYDVGQPDGVVGPKTMAVVAQLQQKAGLTPTGLPDQRLLEALLAAQ